ncbi:MAG: hypothetical protein EXR36_02420 [Betaproteobacteria bacterium]|nr:hypothetical protein [Betaproteobacteria bacterium]
MDDSGNTISRNMGHALARADAQARPSHGPTSRGKPETGAADEPATAGEGVRAVPAKGTDAAIERLQNTQERVTALSERLAEKFSAVQSNIEARFDARAQELPDHAQADVGARLDANADRMLERFSGVKQDVLDHLGEMTARIEQRLQALYDVQADTGAPPETPISESV